MKHWLVLILISSLLVPKSAFAQEQGMVINQIQVSGPAGASDEFIELKNLSDESVSLIGWSLQYKTDSGSFPLSSKKNLPEVVIPAKGYYLIAHNDYTGLVTPDLRHSSFSMSGASTGATVFLSKSTSAVINLDDNNIVDKVAYGEESVPVPESGKSITRKETNNLVEYVMGESIPKNSSFIPTGISEEEPVAEPEETPEEQEEEVPEEQPTEQNEEEMPVNQEAENEPEPIVYSSNIVISEFLPNPEGADSGEEWVELYNSSDAAIDLTGWIIDDEGAEIGSSAVTLSATSISAKQYLRIAIPEGKISLNNTSPDSVRLFWPNKTLLKEVEYVGPAKEDQSWCLLSNVYKWCQPTPGAGNLEIVVTSTSNQTTSSTNSNTNTNSSTQTSQTIDYSTYKIRILELLPDPEGIDSGHETVKLINQGEVGIDIKGWILDDGEIGEKIGSTAYTLVESTLEPGDEAEVTIPKGRFALNNSGRDVLRLFSPDKILKDIVEYTDPKEGVVYSKISGAWAWAEEVLNEEVLEAPTNAALNASSLPRTGLSFNTLFIVFLLLIWYIGVGFSKSKGTYEQTRSNRCVGNAVGK